MKGFVLFFPCVSQSTINMNGLATENKKIAGSLTGISVGAMVDSQAVTETQKIWRSFQALGDIAFAYSYSLILIEIQVFKYKYLFFILEFIIPTCRFI